jgi:hypothetical protein
MGTRGHYPHNASAFDDMQSRSAAKLFEPVPRPAPIVDRIRVKPPVAVCGQKNESVVFDDSLALTEVGERVRHVLEYLRRQYQVSAGRPQRRALRSVSMNGRNGVTGQVDAYVPAYAGSQQRAVGLTTATDVDKNGTLSTGHEMLRGCLDRGSKRPQHVKARVRKRRRESLGRFTIKVAESSYKSVVLFGTCGTRS